MKLNNIKNRIHSICILLIIILIQSCSKTDPCPKGQENYYNLTDEEKSKIPYTGTDTLVFISDNGDTARLIGQGKQQTYKRTTSGGNPDCGAGSYVYENCESVEVNYLDLSNKLVNLDYKINVTYLGTSSSLSLNVNSIGLNNYILFYANNELNYKDTLTIDNTLYKGIYLKDGTNTVNLLFNYKYGILNIKNIGGKNWKRKF